MSNLLGVPLASLFYHPHGVPKYHKFNASIILLFCLSSTNFSPNHHHLLSWIQQSLSKPVPHHHFDFLSSFPYYSHKSPFSKGKTKHITYRSSTLPTLSRLLRWLLMVQKTLTALFPWSSRPSWEPSGLPSSSHTTFTLAVCDSLHLQDFPCSHPERAP